MNATNTNKANPGQIIALLGAAIGLICYFLPWIEGGLFGFTQAVSAMRILTETKGGNSPVQLWLPLFALVAALVTAGAGVFKRPAPDGKNVSALLILAGLVSSGTLSYLYFEFHGEMNRQPSDPFGQLLQGLARSIVTVNILPGAYGAFIGSLAVMLGGLLGRFGQPAIAVTAKESAEWSLGSGPQAYAPRAQPSALATPFPAQAPRPASPGSPCFHCGAQVRADAAFCGNCGAQMPR
jgi:hypothetical protein